MNVAAAIAGLIISMWLGLMKKNDLERELKRAEILLRDIRKLRDMTALAPLPITEAVSKLECGVWSVFAEQLAESRELEIAWNNAADATELHGCENVLNDIGDMLRLTDTEAQIAAMDMISSELAGICNEMGQKYREKGKLYVSLGALMGLAFAVLVI